MSEMGDDFRAMQDAKSREADRRRRRAWREYHSARVVAAAAGLILQRHGESHYSLQMQPTETAPGWTLHLYPGNGRVYRGHDRHAPFLDVRQDWTLMDVVGAATRALQGAAAGGGTH